MSLIIPRTQVCQAHDCRRWVEDNGSWVVKVFAEQDYGVLAFGGSNIDMGVLTGNPIYVSTQPVQSKVNYRPLPRYDYLPRQDPWFFQPQQPDVTGIQL